MYAKNKKERTKLYGESAETEDWEVALSTDRWYLNSFFKNVITNDRIKIGDYTMYNEKHGLECKEVTTKNIDTEYDTTYNISGGIQNVKAG